MGDGIIDCLQFVISHNLKVSVLTKMCMTTKILIKSTRDFSEITAWVKTISMMQAFANLATDSKRFTFGQYLDDE